MDTADVAIIGAGAAGLAAAGFAGEAARGLGARIVLLDGAKKPGAKILVSGGGRCNVTNERVTPEDFCGGPRTIIRNVLRAFDEQKTIAWMRRLGVELKLEPGGKYFPASDSARTVLDALLHGAVETGVELRAGVRVADIHHESEGFDVHLAEGGAIRARRLIVATGGLSLPKSGSDGVGLTLMHRLGHAIVPTTPALVPLLLRPGVNPGGHFADFSGITFDARLGLYAQSGKKLAERTDSLLFTHLGISGPVTLDLSRHWLRARLERPAEPVFLCMGHPRFSTPEDADAWLQQQAAASPRRMPAAVVSQLFPERIADALTEGLNQPMTYLGRPERLALARALTRLPLDVMDSRGYSFAETTAGGVDLREVVPHTMESRRVPGLHLCGEMLDVDGRIGGFNFQWAWASGHLAGHAAVRGL